jgi:aspartyl-tRNA(Asn)/glutamyl-tRNA(Gln) amidotransferase subunit B
LVNIELDGEEKTIRITRAHLEEDAGKSLHEDFQGLTGIDLNRAGTPLLEIVSEPDMRSGKEAVAYMKKLHSLVRYLQICDGNMQEGSFRCDANVSVRPKGQSELGTRTELKNLNSFRFVERAINFEVERQIDILESGGQVVQETRLYDADNNQTRSMRSKEEANDYRYFPDPDLLPLVIEPGFLEQMKAQLPELPNDKKQRFMEQYGLSLYDASTLTSSRELADYFEQTVKESGSEAKLCANWIMGDLTAFLNKNNLEITASPVTASQLAGLLRRITDKTISGKIAKQVFEALWRGEGEADGIIEKHGWKQVTDSSAIDQLIDEILANNPKQLQQYREGKEKLFGFFVGQVMKASKGQANPGQVNELLKKKL